MSYVWYACYGSNINYDRFMIYINRCSDKTPPRESKPYTFPFELYFADYSIKWKGAPCFLNEEKEGFTLGRRYLVTEEQYKEIKKQEGPLYKRKITLDPIDGIPVYSFTNENVLPRKTTSLSYFQTIVEGLIDTYPSKDELELKEYLLERMYSEEELMVLDTLRNARHYLTNQQISIQSGLSLSKTKETVASLVNKQSIQQDARSIRAQHCVNDDEAYFYTVLGDEGVVRTFIDAMRELAKDIKDYHENATNEDLESICYVEGRPVGVYTTKYERSQKNRKKAIEVHGSTCMACGFNFEEIYGEHGKDYIEVHHVKPLSTLDEEVVIHPETDLVCVCSNCHRMLHRKRNEVLTIEELKEIMNRNR